MKTRFEECLKTGERVDDREKTHEGWILAWSIFFGTKSAQQIFKRRTAIHRLMDDFLLSRHFTHLRTSSNWRLPTPTPNGYSLSLSCCHLKRRTYSNKPLYPQLHSEKKLWSSSNLRTLRSRDFKHQLLNSTHQKDSYKGQHCRWHGHYIHAFKY